MGKADTAAVIVRAGLLADERRRFSFVIRFHFRIDRHPGATIFISYDAISENESYPAVPEVPYVWTDCKTDLRFGAPR